ncbi:MAG: type I secretion system permease/ATPase [Gammaproteobacteria bacterium]|jgi:ATP-binding cassette subfamily C protein LapB
MPSSSSATSSEHAWHLHEAAVQYDDPLLFCLVLLTKTYDVPTSADALRAGLPLVENRLTPELFVRSAARVGLSAQIVKRPLRKISSLVLPAVLLLKDEQACVLSEINPMSGHAVIIEPETGIGEQKVSLARLEHEYLGYAVFVKPEHHFDQRAPDVLAPPTRHWFWGTLARSWRIYRDVLVASFLINLFALASPLFLMNVYDRVVPNNAVETLWVLVIGVSLVYGFDLLMRGLRSYFIDVAGKKADVALSAMIFEKVMGIRMEARPVSVGAFANNLSEFESVRNFITSGTVAILVDLPFTLLFLAVIAAISLKVVLIPLAGIPIIVVYGLMVQAPLRDAVDKSFRAAALKNATLVESLIGMEVVKTLGAEGILQRRWEQAVGFISRWGARARLLTNSVANAAIFVQQLATVGVVAASVYLIADAQMSMGGLIAVVILTSRAMAPMGQVVNLAAHYHQAKAALKTLNSIMNMPVERAAGQSFVSRPRLDGAIEFDEVAFSYPGQSTQALRKISFKVKPGEHVGIIGRTGSGKTTIEKLVLGLYSPTGGAVRIDGVDVRQLDPAELRRNIGYVPQDPMLFYGTVRENILFGSPYVDDRSMIRAAENAGVSEFVDRHPLGYDMPLGERGEGLSGGQRQSMMIARALLHDPPVMLMDEPSNSMDNGTEFQLKQRLAELIKGKTFLLVTHRASLLGLVDRLLVVDNGMIVADGPKDEVLNLLKEGRVRAETS